jgi:ABC-2 type transport system ATP-binding protein
MSSSAISVEDVSKAFRIYHERNQTLKAAVMRRGRGKYEDFYALRDVTFDIPEASTFALIGDNGSGKSTLLKCMAKILYPDQGSITLRGRVAALLEVGSGFHPELSGRDNVYLNGSILGMTRKEIDRKFDEIVDFSGVEQFIDQPVKNYSSGMYVRLGFSVAINVDPEILLVDEVLSVGDAAFQEKCAEKFTSFRREGRTVVVVSHSLASLRGMSDQAAWLDKGVLREVGAANGVLTHYEDASHSDTNVVHSGKQHSGTGEVRVERVEIGPTGRLGSPITVGDSVTVRVHYDTTSRVDWPNFGLGFEAMDGAYLAATNTRNTNRRVPFVEGPGVIECTIPSVRFHPGIYIMTAVVADESSTHAYDRVHDVARFTVESGDATWSGGYMALPAEWGEVAPALRDEHR